MEDTNEIQEAKSLTEELLDFIDEQEIEELNISTEDNFTIKDREQANYLIKQYNKLQAELNEVNETAKSIIEKHKAKVEAWKEEEARKRSWTMEWLASRLKAYAKEQLINAKTKTLTLPEGKMSFRKNEETNYEEDILRKYLQSNPHYSQFLTTPPPKIDKVKLKAAGKFKDGKLMLDGQVVPGIEKVTLEDKFSIS